VSIYNLAVPSSSNPGNLGQVHHFYTSRLSHLFINSHRRGFSDTRSWETIGGRSPLILSKRNWRHILEHLKASSGIKSDTQIKVCPSHFNYKYHAQILLRLAGWYLHGRCILCTIHTRLPAKQHISLVFVSLVSNYILISDTRFPAADIVSQFSLMYQNTIQTPGVENYIGLMYHGYDYSQKAVWASQDRGHSPEVWIRAQGWYMMALVDTLEIIPESITGRDTLLQILQTLAPRIRDAADPASGVWWLVMTQPGREGNYLESSGSAMFVYSLLKGVRLGYIPDDDGSIVKAARKAYQYMVENWVVENDDGTMGWKNTVQVVTISFGKVFLN